MVVQFVLAIELLFVCTPVPAATIGGLQAIALKLRAQRKNPPGWRGESPLLTSLKHDLRDWVESRLAGEIRDPAAFASALNSELKRAGLICPEDHCWADNNLGYLGDVEISAPENDSGWLVVTTSVGIVCECDQSIYLYEWRDHKWKRQVQSEQNGYGRGHYGPLWARGHLSLPDAKQRRLFLTIGASSACASVWQEGYFQLFQLGSAPRQIFQHRQSMLNIGYEINERVEPDDVLIEFGSSGLEPGFVRPYILHFKVDGSQAKRVEPIALQPADFVDEWLTQPWLEISEWSEPNLVRLHAALRGKPAEFVYAQHCAHPTDAWQVGVSFEKRGTFHFLIEDRGGHRYRMRDVSTHRDLGCPGEEPIDFDKYPTLFPAREHR